MGGSDEGDDVVVEVANAVGFVDDAAMFAFRVFAAAVAAVAFCSLGCADEKPSGPPPSRFDGVKRTSNSAQATRSFCEVSWPAAEGGKVFAVPVEKPIPGYQAPVPGKPMGAWRWVNLWATWCRPCIEEIGLLGKWHASLKKDGVALDLDLYSVDDDEAALTAWMKKTNMPGTVRWLKGGANDLPAVLESLGVDKGAPIPVHALVDGDGKLRCVRTGSVHDEDYGAVKAILTGG